MEELCRSEMKQKQQKKILNALGEVRYARVVKRKKKSFLFLSAKANIFARAECHNGGGQRRPAKSARNPTQGPQM